TTGTLLNAADGVLRVLQGTGGGRVINAELDNRGTLEVAANLELLAGANHRNSGLMEVTAGTTTVSAGSFSNQGETRVMAAATLVLSGAALANSATGLLSGTGTLDLSAASAATNVGVVAPGVSSGTLRVTGDYPQSAGGRLQLEIGGFTPTTQYDRLMVSGQALLGGLVRATLVNGFLPKKDDAFTVLTYASRNGSFAAVQSAEPERIAWRMQYGATSAQLIVANTAPTLAAIANQTVNEETVLSLTPTATDQDLPPQTFTYSLTTAPAGMTINPSSGLITWTPAEAQGPGVHNVTVRVTDNGTPALGHTTSFSVTVNEVNLAPVLPALPDATMIHAGTTFTANLSATDSDLPANTLTYSLPTGPSDATLSPAGVVSWSAPVTAAGTVADFTVGVTDNGLPTASDNRSFQVQVTGRLEILSSAQTGAQLEVTWRAIPGRIYRLIASDTLPATEWTPVPGDIEATGATATKTIPIGALAGGNYFRVELVGE
ncbi:MAG: putative Ig domain-containing protein, partial [Verrucomicrobiales bacterium]|nr:putative Ig domain-containing protein [Verrucomicrobiales bacterium]